MCIKISYKCVKNESYKINMNTSKPIFANFTSILKKLIPKWLQKNLPYKTVLAKSNKNVKCASYKYLYVIKNICKVW
jgi:hypothetical protein